MPAIDPDKLEAHVRAFDTRIRRRNVVEAAACAVLVALFLARALGLLPGAPGPGVSGWLTRAGDVLVALAAIFVSVQVHRLARPVAPGLRAAGLLTFHIEQLQRQSAALKSSPLWYVAPFLPGIVLIFGGYAAGAGVAIIWPLLGGGATLAVLAGIIWLNLNAAKEFDAEIKWLEEMERQSLG